MIDGADILFGLVVVVAVMAFRTRDYYVVIREFRIIQPNEFDKGKTIESSHLNYFDDYLAARAFFDFHDQYAAFPSYENRQQINYIYAVPALTAKRACAKMTKRVHHEAKLLMETPFSTLSKLKQYWDEERKVRDPVWGMTPSKSEG
jgi:hypothetical protein